MSFAGASASRGSAQLRPGRRATRSQNQRHHLLANPERTRPVWHVPGWRSPEKPPSHGHRSGSSAPPHGGRPDRLRQHNRRHSEGHLHRNGNGYRHGIERPHPNHAAYPGGSVARIHKPNCKIASGGWIHSGHPISFTLHPTHVATGASPVQPLTFLTSTRKRLPRPCPALCDRAGICIAPIMQLSQNRTNRAAAGSLF